MKGMFIHVHRQQETLAVVSLAVIAVIAYAAWGASVLKSSRQASPAAQQLAQSSPF